MSPLPGGFRLRPYVLLLTVGPTAALLALLYTVVGLGASLHEQDEEHIRVTADLVAGSLQEYLTRQVGTVAALTRIPAVTREVASLGDRVYRQTDVDALDRAWIEGEAAPEPIMTGALAQFLQTLTGSPPESPYNECLIADANGRLIAASNRTEDYYQADDDWWPSGAFNDRCAASPTDCASIIDVGFDPSADVSAFAVVMPIVSSAEVRGVMKVVIDTTALETLSRLGAGNQRLIIRILQGDGRDVLDEAFEPDSDLANILADPGTWEEWSEEGRYLRRVTNRFQTAPWAVYVVEPNADVGADTLLAGPLLVFSAVIAAVTLGIALVVTSRVGHPHVPSEP